MMRTFLIISTCYLLRLVALPLAPFSSGIWQLYRAQLFPLTFWGTLRLGYRRRFAKWERQMVWRRIKAAPAPLLSWAQLVGEEYLTTARRSQRGILLVTFHSPFFRVFQYLINQLEQSWRPYLFRYNADSGEREGRGGTTQHQLRIFNGRVLDLNRAGVSRMTKMLLQGETVIISPDSLDLTRPKVKLFGRQLPLILGAVRLAELTEALILPAIVTGRLWGRPWQLHFWEPIDPRQGSTQARLISAWEEVLSAYPEIWNRWHMVLTAPQPQAGA